MNRIQLLLMLLKLHSEPEIRIYHGALRRPPRWGLSLLEVLVMIALLALLLVILLPVIRAARIVASDAVCTSRLRDLAMASMVYHQDNGRYPNPSLFLLDLDATTSAVIPHDIKRRLINDLSKYLRYPRVAAGTPAENLPHHTQAPWAEKIRSGRGPKKKLAVQDDGEYYYTGYIYLGELDRFAIRIDPLAANELTGEPVLLQPERVGSSRQMNRGVLWADDLHHSALTGEWQFGHAGVGANGMIAPFTFPGTSGLRGQHRAYNDGSVEWIDAGRLNVNVNATLEMLNTDSSYRIGDSYWWF